MPPGGGDFAAGEGLRRENSGCSRKRPLHRRIQGRSIRGAADADRKIADTFSSYFANFIRTGGPNGKGLPHWPSTVEQPETTMEIGDKYAVIPVAGSKEKLAFLEAYLTKPRPGVTAR